MTFKFLFTKKQDLPVKVAFLDRDGVINIDHGYVNNKQHFTFVEGALEGMKLLSEKGYSLVLITNQSGIGRGKYTIFDFAKLTFWLEGLLFKNGSPFSAVYFCPHHPQKAFAPFLQECDCRKPQPGMILSAIKDLNIDVENSLFIGDKESDMRAALGAGIPTRILVKSDGTAPFDAQISCTRTANTLLEAAKTI